MSGQGNPTLPSPGVPPLPHHPLEGWRGGLPRLPVGPQIRWDGNGGRKPSPSNRLTRGCHPVLRAAIYATPPPRPCNDLPCASGSGVAKSRAYRRVVDVSCVCFYGKCLSRGGGRSCSPMPSESPISGLLTKRVLSRLTQGAYRDTLALVV